MPLTSAYWPVPFVSVAQSVFIVVLLLCSMEIAVPNIQTPLVARIHRCRCSSRQSRKATVGFEPATRCLQIRQQLKSRLKFWLSMPLSQPLAIPNHRKKADGGPLGGAPEPGFPVRPQFVERGGERPPPPSVLRRSTSPRYLARACAKKVSWVATD